MNANQDILDYLSKVFRSGDATTPKHIVDAMLDLIPHEVFGDKTKTFLCPATKDGVFLREILFRILNAYKVRTGEDAKKIAREILGTRIFGIALTYKDYMMSRRTLYGCTDDENEIGYRDIDNIFYDFTESLSEPQKDKLGNLFPYQYTFIKIDEYLGKAKNSGAELVFQVKGTEDKVLYEKKELLYNKLNTLKNMTFDVIIGNPPYQLNDGSGGSSDAAIPIYNKFIEHAISFNPQYMSMIIPSKWMVGGRGLDAFRNKMIADKHIRCMFDFEDASDCFQNLHIDGGVNYFLWDKNYNGMIDFTYKASDGSINNTKRHFYNDSFQYVIRDNRRLPVIEKVARGKRFSDIVSSTQPYGIRKDLFNSPERYPESNLQFEPFENCLKIYGVQGIKGGARRKIGYISKKIVTNNLESVNKYKLFFTTSYSTNAINPPEIIIGEQDAVCTETFLMIGHFKNENEQKNCLSYMNTSFFKILLYFGKGTMQVTKSVFGLIPLQDFSESWTDEKLYKKYNLSPEEIAFIESMIKPIPDSNNEIEEGDGDE